MKYLSGIVLLIIALASCSPKPEQKKESSIVEAKTSYLPYQQEVKKPLDNYLHKVYINKDGIMQYRVLYPENFDPHKKYPMILMIHGMGECGSNNASQLNNGGKFFLNEDFRKNHPAIVVFPQCPRGYRWDSKVMPGSGKEHYTTKKKDWYWTYDKAPNHQLAMLMDFTKDFINNSGIVDKSRCYVGGISMGCMTAYEISYRMPNTFAAGYYMSGGGNPKDIVAKCSHMAFRIMHGDADNVVDPAYADRMEAALKAANIEVVRNTYHGIGHGPWNDPMFKEPGLMDWLFSHHL
ncbi:alpha/beta hydrolase-fold protein [Persicobacter psychrovividus]|uniref:Phospholipase n=1 Tax=Persicobacter psychrovividus TaxID=387638 RepID=A0ABN6LBT5_9BACT|nr:phospholipase [Persicobacter psychrovividus]